ncbi:MAG: DUF2505 domain-containing protein [Ilumatobacteraceae bacterium]|jgi:hypothetical protein
MKVASTHVYSAPPDVVYAAMSSPEVMVAKYVALGHLDVKIIEHTQCAGITSVRSRRAVPVDPPGFARRFFDPVTVVDQHDEWDPPMPDGSHWGIWQVSARGVPVTTGGQLRLGPTADGTGTVVEITGEVNCPMPIIGGRVAAWVGGDVERTMAAEAAFLDGYLREQALRAASGGDGVVQDSDPTPHRKAS